MNASSAAAAAATTVAAVVLLREDSTVDREQKTTTTNFFKGMVSSYFNIQYQSTGVGSLSLLDEIELRRSIRGVFS